MSSSIKDTAEIFKAMGEETRLKIIKLIASKGNQLCVGAIANRLGVSQPAVSQHLKVLKNAGLLEAVREGYHVHYKLVGDALTSYGINLIPFLKTFGAEMDLDSCCEHKNNSEKCSGLN